MLNLLAMIFSGLVGIWCLSIAFYTLAAINLFMAAVNAVIYIRVYRR